jgi:hypothetical protein
MNFQIAMGAFATNDKFQHKQTAIAKDIYIYIYIKKQIDHTSQTLTTQQSQTT